MSVNDCLENTETTIFGNRASPRAAGGGAHEVGGVVSKYSGLRVCLHRLFADHDVENHVVGVLHTDGADATEVLDSLLDILLDDAVV